MTGNGKRLRPGAGKPACRSGALNDAQRFELRLKCAEGFELVREENGCAVIRNGNDWRLIRQDGKTQRAYGAKR